MSDDDVEERPKPQKKKKKRKTEGSVRVAEKWEKELTAREAQAKASRQVFSNHSKYRDGDEGTINEYEDGDEDDNEKDEEDDEDD